MKYWAYFLAKLAAVYAVASGLKWLIRAVMPPPDPRFANSAFTRDLPWTTAIMVYSLICIGLVYLVILDQKFRCRTCLRRLRMPVNTGSWSRAMIFSPPKTEYICPYGHGTMKQRNLQISGRERPDWVEHEDIWTELESMGRKK
ncbi:MAG: hypothetical protein SFV18_04995 [Bryobacteraceae bacterium]|nr:hypothetical protein [Bryobacteraceae bacterium]